MYHQEVVRYKHTDNKGKVVIRLIDGNEVVLDMPKDEVKAAINAEDNFFLSFKYTKEGVEEILINPNHIVVINFL